MITPIWVKLLSLKCRTDVRYWVTDINPQRNEIHDRVYAWVGIAYARSLAPCAILLISVYGDTAGIHWTFQGKIIARIPVYGISISSHSRHLFASNLHVLNYWLAYTMLTLICWWFCNSYATRHEFWVRLRKRVKFEVWKILLDSIKFHLLKLTVMFEIDYWKFTLTACRHPVQNGLMQTVNIVSTGNEHLHAPAIIRSNRMRASWRFCVWKQNRPLFLSTGVWVVFVICIYFSLYLLL